MFEDEAGDKKAGIRQSAIDTAKLANYTQSAPSSHETTFMLVTNPCCRQIFLLVRLVGSLVMLANLTFDITYAARQEFASVGFILAYSAVLALRLIDAVALGAWYLKK